jgi:glutathione S-transferase
MPTLYDFLPSGNGYKARLMMRRLGIAYTYVERDILTGETRTPEFLAMNPNGKIPVLVLDDGTALSESDAILYYLAEGTPWWPEDRLSRARVLEWMFFEQYSHETAIAVRRFVLHFMPEDSPRRAELPALEKKGYAALGVMEHRLADHDWLVGNHETIADLALYGYTHVADEAGLDLAGYPGIRSWLARVASHPAHVPIGMR